MTRLSSPPGAIRPHYAIVVVGSGYGGAIAASRLARAGRDVCLLERGREIQPGEYPDTSLEAVQDVQADMAGRHLGPATALFDLRMNDDISVVQGCGLGGTSLINASVCLRPDPRVFLDRRWPEAIRTAAGALDEDFGRVEAMLGAAPYPSALPLPKKLEALERCGAGMGTTAVRVPLAVTFEDGVNAAGVVQKACTLCGDCVSGCNHEAKNSLVMNYLPDAKRHGAAIFTGVQVRHVSRRGGQWLVHYRLLDAGRETFGSETMHVSADVVILAAGALGSTEILLRSREKGLPLSARLGSGFSGNGDVLAFAYNCDREVNGVGWGTRTAEDLDDPSVGPCITGAVDLRGSADLEAGIIIEEGALPGALAPLMPVLMAGTSGLLGADTDSGLLDSLQEGGRSLSSLLGGAYRGAVRNSVTFLAMAHDSSDGTMTLEDDRLRIHWDGVGERPIFSNVHEQVHRATAALGGTTLKNPLWTGPAGKRLVTVHPLGGCPMAEDAASGVVNHKGEVFSGEADAVHAGLFVCDGAVVPRSLGVNPLLTIGALAERSARLLAHDRGWEIDYARRSAIPAPEPLRPGLQFTERMTGYFHPGAASWQEGWEEGAARGTALSFVLTIRVEDVEAMLADQEHRAGLAGTVQCEALSSSPLTAGAGEFRLLSIDQESVGTRQMVYTMTLDDVEGRRFCLRGHKVIRDDAGIDIWSDTTTLYVTVHDGPDTSADVLGRGILRITPVDFLRQLTTMRVVNAGTLLERLRTHAAFGRFFAGALYDTYGGVFARATTFEVAPTLRKKRTLDLPAPEVRAVTAADGVQLRLTRYAGGTKGPVLLAPGMGTSTLTFTLDTVDRNTAECLCAAGYDVWLFDYRASSALVSSRAQFTLDEIARLDYPAAIREVRAATGAESVQVAAHCVASASLLMSLLSGEAEGVRSAICSQFGLFIEGPRWLRAKAALRLGTLVQAAGVDLLRTRPDGPTRWRDRVYDAALRLQPTDPEERCDSPVCRRIRFIWGEVFRHQTLNHQTHRLLHEVFGAANLSTMRHLSTMLSRGRLTDSAGQDVYLPEVARLKLPVTLLQGMRNRTFLPAGMDRTWRWLREQNGSELYTLKTFPDYAHMDLFIGKDASTDVMPTIVGELDRFN